MTERHETATILIADDHPLVLQGLRDFLALERLFQIVGDFMDGRAAMEGIMNMQPAVAVVDVKLPSLNGFEIFTNARDAGSKTPIVLLSAELSDEQIVRAAELGVEGLLLKSAAPNDLLECLHHVLSGRRWLPASLVKTAAERLHAKQAAEAVIFGDLTDREKDVIVLVVRGLQNKEIARLLNISPGTVKIHLNNIYSKLGVDNRTALTSLVLPHLSSGHMRGST